MTLEKLAKRGTMGNSLDAIAGSVFGMVLYADSNMPPPWEYKQVRFPRSKKARMRKKWRKNRANWLLVDLPPQYFVVGSTCVAHPDSIRILRHWVAKLNIPTELKFV